MNLWFPLWYLPHETFFASHKYLPLFLLDLCESWVTKIDTSPTFTWVVLVFCPILFNCRLWLESLLIRYLLHTCIVNMRFLEHKRKWNYAHIIPNSSTTVASTKSSSNIEQQQRSRLISCWESMNNKVMVRVYWFVFQESVWGIMKVPMKCSNQIRQWYFWVEQEEGQWSCWMWDSCVRHLEKITNNVEDLMDV